MSDSEVKRTGKEALEKADQMPVPAGASASEPSLTARVVKGAAWVFAGKVFGRGLSLVKLIVLARLLSPEDFGLFGIVMLAIAALHTFTQTGFNTALIQRKEGTQEFLDTAWTVQVIRGLVLAAILFSAAPVVGWFFNEPRAVPLLRVMCVSVVLGGFVNVGIIYFRKELEFHKQFIYDLGTAIVSVVVGIVLAYQLRSVWALIWAGMAGAATRCILSYVIHPYRPRARFDGAQASELFRFGRWVLASAVLYFLITHGDDVVAGRLLGVGALGLYQVAYRLSELPLTGITSVVKQVTFPALSKIQDNPQMIGPFFGRALGATAVAVVPLSVGIVVLATDGTTLLLGDQWAPMVPALQLLALSALIQSVTAPAGSLFRALGRPGLGVILNFTRLGVMAVSIIPLTVWFGLHGAASSVLAGSVAKLPISFFLTSKMSGLSYKALGARIGVPLAASSVAAGVVMASGLLFRTGEASLFVARCVIFGAVYVGCLALMRVNIFWEAFNALRSAASVSSAVGLGEDGGEAKAHEDCDRRRIS